MPFHSGYAYNSPLSRCENDRIVLTAGWLPSRYLELYNRFLQQPEFLNYTIEMYRSHNVLEFTHNFTAGIASLRPLLRYDWSLWKDAHIFECRTPLFQLENDAENYGGRLRWQISESIDDELNSWIEYLHGRTSYLSHNYMHVGTREDQKKSAGWGPLTVAFFSLWSLFLALGLAIGIYLLES